LGNHYTFCFKGFFFFLPQNDGISILPWACYKKAQIYPRCREKELLKIFLKGAFGSVSDSITKNVMSVRKHEVKCTMDI